jgi:hypothetical protein
VQRLSIIVPFVGNLKRLEDTLVSVLENQPQRSEVVVVLNQPYEDPYDLRGEVKFVEAAPGADLVDCFACGLAASSAPIVHVLAPGYEATVNWADAALTRFDEPAVAAVAPVVIDRESPDRILSAGLSYSRGGSIRRVDVGRRLDGFAANDNALCGPELAVAFYRRAALETLGSVPHYCSQLAVATDLALSFRTAGYSSVQEPACRATATGEILASGGAWREGVACERLFRRWAATGEGERSWAAHAALLGTECLQSPFRPSMLGRFAGRCWAMLGVGSMRTLNLGKQDASSATVSSNQSDAVIRPPHFGSAETHPALQSRAAG